MLCMDRGLLSVYVIDDRLTATSVPPQPLDESITPASFHRGIRPVRPAPPS
jgi:hypothetical protein